MTLEFSVEMRSQTTTTSKPPKQETKPKPLPKKVPAQNKLGGGNWNKNIVMPTGGAKDDD